MKKLLLIAGLLMGLQTQAQKYKDSLYDAYKNVYWEIHNHDLEYTNVLYRTADSVFSVNYPVMRYAMTQTKLEDSLAMDMLGREIMQRFIDDKFMLWACDHYKEEDKPILDLYTTDLCTKVSHKMTVAGKMPAEKMAKALEKAMTDGSIELSMDERFREKAMQVRTDYGTDRIITSSECNPAYMQVHCPYIRSYMVNACVGKAVDKYMALKRAELMKVYTSVREYLLSGEDETIKQYAPDKAVSAELHKSLAAIRKRTKELKPDKTNLLFRPVMKANKVTLSYLYVSPQPEILGGIALTMQWKDYKWNIKQSSYIPEKDVQDKQALLNVAAMQKTATQ